MAAVLTGAAILAGSSPTSHAGDREWATAGKVLTGLFAGALIHRALEPAPVVYVAPPPTVTHVAPAQTVYVASPPPPPVAYVPARTIIYHAPAPVFAAPAVYLPPRPIVHFGVSFGRGYGHSHHHPRPGFSRGCR